MKNLNARLNLRNYELLVKELPQEEILDFMELVVKEYYAKKAVVASIIGTFSQPEEYAVPKQMAYFKGLPLEELKIASVEYLRKKVEEEEKYLGEMIQGYSCE